ncbi:HAMP domain-containing histidine kinase [Marivirga sp. S37H4]|uniref:histidine kinase n=1 Tax=Marivirga aurantiaca TaxID=2802615 RepID=A0A935C764_9BACT|nr:HAMP domain-containing sensor histidine kinase [Marivirga aurantiaca]MBK6264821.1 HAMP domain-containing histidine kinase [Marivirga aurantiaca]
MRERDLHSFSIRIIFLSAILIMVSWGIMAQNPPQTLNDSILYYIQQAESSWHKDIQKASESAEKAYFLSKKTNSPYLITEAIAQYGISFYSNSEYDSAEIYYDSAYQIALKHNLYSSIYLTLKSAALGKKSYYFKIIELVDTQYPLLMEGDSNKVNLLLSQLSATLEIGRSQKADSIIKIIERDFSGKTSDSHALKILNLKGKYYSQTADYTKSDSIIKYLIPFYQSSGDLMDEGKAYLILAENAMSISNYDESMQYLIMARKLYERLSYQFGIATTKMMTGSLYSYLSDYNEAFTYLFEALEYFEENENLNEIQKIYYELGWILHLENLNDRARNYLSKSIKISRQIKNYISLGDTHNAFGSLYLNMKQNDSALIHFDRAIHYFSKTGNMKSLAASKFNKAIVLEKKGQNQNALVLYRETYQVDKKLGNTLGKTEGEYALGEFFRKNNIQDSAHFYLEMGEKNAETLSDKSLLLKIYKSQAAFYTQTNNYPQANSYLQKAMNLQDELFIKEKELQLAALETSYDLKNKEKELDLLTLQMDNNAKTIALNNKKIQSQNNLLIGLSIGILLLLLLSYIIYRYLQVKTRNNEKLKKLNKEIQEKQEEILTQSEELQASNQFINEMNALLEKKVIERTTALQRAHTELDKFFYRASHDFRGPLTTMMGLVEVSRLTTTDPSVASIFDNVDVTAKKLDKMVRKLQSVSFLSDYQELPDPDPIHLDEFLKFTVEKFTTEHIHKKLKFKVKNSAPKQICFYTTFLEICLHNLIENSITFNYNETIVINIDLWLEKEHLHLTVSDNGHGIPAELQENIFEMFEKSSHISKGNGLGLYLVKKVVNKLNGYIRLESSDKEGSIFHLEFPLFDKPASDKPTS